MVIEHPEIGDLRELVQERTHHRVRELTVAYQNNRVVLRGITDSFYLKQLAQHGIMDVMPNARVENAIIVRQ
jgi:hypothetical protein